MKSFALLLALSSIDASAQSSEYVNFIRQNQQGTTVVWDMPVAAAGTAPSALAHESSGSLFQLWTVAQTTAKEHLLDQKLVGAYLPKADIKITTLDPYSVVPRTRVDQPFSVEIQVADLLTGSTLPEAATKVLLEQHVASYPTGQTSLDPATVAANTPINSAFVSQNGTTVLNFAATSLKATDPTKALGEEHFIVHALAEGSISQSQIASAHVQVWPVASGEIIGITPGQELRYQVPSLQINLHDLYPRSDTSLILYEGSEVNGSEGTLLKSYPMDRDTGMSIILDVPEVSSAITQNGTYTLALVSETVYGPELLCPPVSFSVKRTIEINAMQVNFDGIAEPTSGVTSLTEFVAAPDPSDGTEN